MIAKELTQQAYWLLSQHKIGDCVDLFETALRQISPTPYHAIIGRDLLHLTENAADYLGRFHDFATRKTPLKSIYLEMNGFAINPDVWYLDAFGYKNYHGLPQLDWLADWNSPEWKQKQKEQFGALDWLCDWDTPDFESFTISGFEDLQAAYANNYAPNTPDFVMEAAAITEFLITLRLQELASAAHREAAKKTFELKQIVVLSTSHEFDFIAQSRI